MSTEIGKLNLDKVDNAIMVRAARKILHKEFSDKGKRTTASALHTHFEAHLDDPGVTMVECDDCGGLSDEELDACPYCGAVDEDAPAQKTPPVKTKPAAETKQAAKTNGANGHAKNGSNGLALAAANGVAVLSVAKLDEAVKTAKSIKAEGAAWAWRLGQHVYKNIYKDNLWTFRLGADGKPLYKNFHRFCQDELGFSHTFIYAMMDISQNLSEEDAGKFGSSHLHYLITAPKESHPELKKMLEGGISVADFKQKVAEVREASGVKVRQGVGNVRPGVTTKAAAKAQEVKTKLKAERNKGVAIILPEGKHTVKLFAKPASKKDELKPARKLADRPVGKISGLNGVDVLFSVQQNAAGQWILSFETREAEQA